MDALGETGALDQAAGMFGAFLGVHRPADDLAAEDVLDQVQAVDLSPDRRGQKGDIPAPRGITNAWIDKAAGLYFVS